MNKESEIRYYEDRLFGSRIIKVTPEGLFYQRGGVWCELYNEESDLTISNGFYPVTKKEAFIGALCSKR